MFSLIIVIVSIAAFTIFLAAGSNYIDGDKIQSSKIQSQLEGAFSQHAAGILQFNLLFKKNPTELAHVSPALIDQPLLPDGVFATDINNYIVPSVGNRVGVCYFANNVGYPTYLSINTLQDKFGNGKLRVVSDCNSTVEISAPTNYPASFYFIYFVKN